MNFEDMLKKNPIIFLSIERSETESLDLTRVNTAMRSLSKFGKEARGRLVFTFSGYDDIPDEIFEITAVRKYVEKVYNRHPYIFYYINQTVESHIPIVLSMCDCIYQKLDKPHNEYTPFGVVPRIPVSARVDGVWLERLKLFTTQHGAKMKDTAGGLEMAEGISRMFPEHRRK